MKRTIRTFAVSAVAVAGVLAAGSGLAAAAPGDQDEPIGPFEALSTCEHEGNLRVVNEGWNDYECGGAEPSWLLYRR